MTKEKAKTKEFVTDSNIPVKPIYNHLKKPKESPGKYPFTRGIHSGMYRDRLWTMRQYSGFGDAAQTNKRYKFMLDSGQTGLSMAFDLPTQIGHDPDSPRAEGEVGQSWRINRITKRHANCLQRDKSRKCFNLYDN